MHKEIRKQMILKRRNFLPSLVVTLFLALTLTLIVYFTDPGSSIFVLLFFINLFAFLFFLFSLIVGNSRRGFIISLCVTIFTLFRMFGIGNILNLILIAGLGIIVEIYANFKR